MQHDHALSDDPVEIVRFLVREHGLEGARQIAVEGTTTANLEGDFYRLSIWREVKRGLRDWVEIPDIPDRGPDETPEEITDLAG